MNVHIEVGVLTRNVKVYIFEDGPSAVTYYWPTVYQEQSGWMWEGYTTQTGQAIDGQRIRPAFEMSLQMWQAFTKAMLETEHVRVDALDIVAKTLEKEQARVDKML